MPPRTSSTYAGTSIQQCRHAIRDVVEIAAALDPSRGGSGLAGATPRQLLNLGRALALLNDPPLPASGEYAHRKDSGPLLVSPEARAALVQLFSSALRIVTPPEELANSSSRSGQLSTSSSGCSTDGNVSHSSRAADSSGLGTAAGFRPVGRQHSSFTAILAACASLIYTYIMFEYHLMDRTGARALSLGWVQTATALLQGDALAAMSRLLAANNRRPAGAKLLPANDMMKLQDLASILLGFAAADDRLRRKQLLPLLATSHLLEHWAAELVHRVGSQQHAAPASSGRTSRSHKSADDCTASSTQSLSFVTDHILLPILRPGSAQLAACADAARQLLSGRCVQYFSAARAVSDLYAADGGPLYGLPYNALLPYMAAERQPGERKGQEALLCSELRSVIKLWGSTLVLCPLEALRPLRPRHLMALCLRIARVALASLGDANPQEQQEPHPQQERQQEQRRVGKDMDEAAGCSLGGASAGQLGAVRQALLGAVELRRRLEAKGCPELAVAAMQLARSLLTATGSTAEGGAGAANVVGGISNTGSCDGGASSVGCSGGSSSGGDGDGSGGVDGSGGGGTRGDAGRPRGEQSRAWARPLLRDSAWADGWWRLALGIVRVALQQDTSRQQQQQRQLQIEEDQELLFGKTGLGCASLLLPLHVDAPRDCGGCQQWGWVSFVPLVRAGA